MNKNSFSFTLCTIFLTLFIFSSSLFAQDSSATRTKYSSLGFQVSFVSGIGISYGMNQTGKYRTRFTGGILTSSGVTYFSFGADYHFELTKTPSFRVFIGPSAGSSGDSQSQPRPRIALGTGIEHPLLGSSVIDNISAGAIVYYPTYFFQSGEVSFAGGIFISYNF